MSSSTLYGSPSAVGPASSDNLNITIWQNHTASLTFNTSKTDFKVIQLAVDALFQTDVFSFTPICTYPISGQYGFLPRLIYYLLLIFSLILRRYEYLSVAALGTSMTYASVACVHAFSLMVRYKYQKVDYGDPMFKEKPPTDLGDADLVGIYPVLVAGCIMLTPILNWSTTVRKNKAGAIIVYWGCLMFAALIATLSKLAKGGVFPFAEYTQLATCHLDRATGCTYDAVVEPNGTYRTAPDGIAPAASFQYWQNCNCNDTCGAIGLDVPFRKGTNMQAWLVSDRTTKILDSKGITWVFIINILFLLFVIGQGILGLLESRWDQAVVRNWMFRYLSGARERPKKPNLLWKFRYYLSKVTVGTFYMGAIVAGVICPLIFISSVIINEFIVHGWPVNERNDAVGQWSTWVGAGFVLLAAVIGQYHSSWVRSAKLGYSTTIRFVKWVFGKAELRAEPIREERNKDNSAIEDFKEFFKQCLRPFVHSWNSTHRAGHRIVLEWRDFKAWHKDPIQSSQQPPTYWGELEHSSMVLPQSAVAPEKSTVIEAHSARSTTPQTEGPSSLELAVMPARSSTVPVTRPGTQSLTPSERLAHGSKWTPFKRPTYERISTNPQSPDAHSPILAGSTDLTLVPSSSADQSPSALQHSATSPAAFERPSMRTTFKRANTDHQT